MFYIEFYSRKPGVSPEVFRETVKRTDAYWARANPQDRPVLAVGRTWRLGGPHYIVVWEIDGSARLDEWKETLATDPEAQAMMADWQAVVDCDAGLYETLGQEQL
jgi:hypothetical protein